MTNQRYHYPDHIRAFALDMATTTGYAILQDGQVRGGAFKVQRKKGRVKIADDHEGKEYADFHIWLARMIAAIQPHYIFFEQPPANFKTILTAYKPLGFRAILMAQAAAGGYPVHGYHVGTIKKAATGSGGAKKPEMIAAAKAQFPHLEIVDDNMADALHVLCYGMATECGVELLRFGH